MKQLFVAILAAGCWVASAGAATVVTVAERYTTAAEPESNIDSVAVLPARDGDAARLFATAKATDVLRVFDAATGRDLGSVGESGTAEGQYLRPNGVSVADALLVVVERDNRRVSIRRLPDLAVLATFGEDVLENPYGVWVEQRVDGAFRIYVTDAYERPDEGIPPNDELDRRVKHWRLYVRRGEDGSPESVTPVYEGAFGETTSPGALRVVESIHGDPRYDRLLIAEEDESPETGLVIKVYDLEGRYKGRQMGRGIFRSQVEGIALNACADGGGYWLATDQAEDGTIVHLFDRESLEHVGAFRGEITANTDGIWFAPEGVPGFEEGAIFAVHDDMAVSAFDWTGVADALGLDVCD